MVAWLIAVGLVSCGREQTVPPPTDTPKQTLTVVPISPTQVIQDVPLVISPATPTPASPALQSLVLEAKRDLAQRLSIPEDQIELVEASAVVWPDGSIGCPQAGVEYTQVQREGLLIRLRVGKRGYAYHSGGGRSLFLCDEASTGVAPVSPPGLENQ